MKTWDEPGTRLACVWQFDDRHTVFFLLITGEAPGREQGGDKLTAHGPVSVARRICVKTIVLHSVNRRRNM